MVDEELEGGASGGGGRLVLVTLKKNQPHGVVTWWKTVLKGDVEIDPTAIQDRWVEPGLSVCQGFARHKETRREKKRNR